MKKQPVPEKNDKPEKKAPTLELTIKLKRRESESEVTKKS